MDDEAVFKSKKSSTHRHPDPGSGKCKLPPDDPSPPLPSLSLRARFARHPGLLRLAGNSGPYPSSPAPGQAASSLASSHLDLGRRPPGPSPVCGSHGIPRVAFSEHRGDGVLPRTKLFGILLSGGSCPGPGPGLGGLVGPARGWQGPPRPGLHVVGARSPGPPGREDSAQVPTSWRPPPRAPAAR